MQGFGVSIVTYYTNLSDLMLSIETLCHTKSVTNIFLIDNSRLPQYSLSSFKHIIFSEKIEIFHLPQNPGYVAHNTGLSESENRGFRFHLILNADVTFKSETLDHLLGVMLNNENVGLLMPGVSYMNGSVQRVAKKLPTPFEMFLRMIGLSNLKTFDITKPSDSKKPIFVPYLSGCFMLMSMNAIKIVGKMDERFFMYGEDIDLSRRIASKFDTVYYPEVSIFHAHGRGSKKELGLWWIHFKNVCVYFNKWGWIVDKERRPLNSKCGLEIALKKCSGIRAHE